MSYDKPQGTEGAEGTVGEDSPYQLVVSKCRALMTEGKKEAASDEYNEAVNLNKDAENDELLLLSDQLDKMNEGQPFSFTDGEPADSMKDGADEGDKWHEQAGQSLKKAQLQKILTKLEVNYNVLTGEKKLQAKFDEYNVAHGYIAPEAPAETPKKEDKPKAEKAKKDDKVKKDKRGKKAKPVTLDDCIESCQKAAVMLQQYERQEREAGHSTRRYRRAWQAIHGMIIRKCLRRS